MRVLVSQSVRQTDDPAGPSNRRLAAAIFCRMCRRTRQSLDGTQPLEAGGQRRGRLTYTFTGQDARNEFGRSGTRFDLGAEDIRGLPIRATFTISGPSISAQ